VDSAVNWQGGKLCYRILCGMGISIVRGRKREGSRLNFRGLLVTFYIIHFIVF
jgi:hypothetical protein